MTSVGSLAAPCGRAMDKKAVSSAEKLSSFASTSSTFLLGRSQNVVLRKSRSAKINAMAKELYFNKDGSAIRKLQVAHALCMEVVSCLNMIALDFELILFGYLFVSRVG